MDGNHQESAPAANPGHASAEDVEAAAMALDFLAAVDAPLTVAAMPPDTPPTCLTVDRWDDEARETWKRRLENLNRKQIPVYFVLNTTRPGLKKKPTEADITFLRCIVVDADPDPHVEAEPGGLDRERVRLKALAQSALNDPDLPATFAVHTGNGVQIGWKLEPALPNTPENRERVKALAQGLSRKFGGDATHSVDHLFRVPGTWNLPNKKKRERGRGPVRASLIGADYSRAYSLAALLRLAPPDSAPKAAAVAFEGFDYVSILEAAEEGLESLPLKLRSHAEQIAESAAGKTALNNDDRSERDYSLVAQCIQAGLTDPTEIGQVAFALSREKLLEKDAGGRGEYYAARTIRNALAKVRPERPEDYFERINGSADLVPTAALTSGRFRLFTLAELREAEPLRFLIDRHIPQGSFGFLYGEPGAGKSFLALSMALSVAYELPDWHGERVKLRHGGRVVYIAAEGSAGLIQRATAWEARQLLPIGRVADFRVIIRPANLHDPNDAVEVIAEIRALGWDKCDLVVIDTLSRSIPGADENAQKDTSKFVKICDAIRAELDCAALVVHHASKSKDSMRGSTVLAGAADFVLRAEKLPGGGAVKLTCEKQKDAADGWANTYRLCTVNLGTDPVTGELLSSLVPERMTQVERSTAEQETNKAIARAISEEMGNLETVLWSKIGDTTRKNPLLAKLPIYSDRPKWTPQAMRALAAPGVELIEAGQTVHLIAFKDGTARNSPWVVRKTILSQGVKDESSEVVQGCAGVVPNKEIHNALQ